MNYDENYVSYKKYLNFDLNLCLQSLFITWMPFPHSYKILYKDRNFPKTFFCIHFGLKTKQAGAELGQAQLKLVLGPIIVDLTQSWGPVTTQIYISLEE